jgi:ABC-type spermidine/putrescine transport system permease subunit I
VQPCRYPDSIRAREAEMTQKNHYIETARKVSRNRDNYRLLILALMMLLCTLFYYFGELEDFLGWEALHWNFFYSVHDFHRLLFLAPIIYAGYLFGARAAIIITVISVNIFLPRALFISPFPDPLPRTILFIIIAGVIGYLIGHQSERLRYLETLVKSQAKTITDLMEEKNDK